MKASYGLWLTAIQSDAERIDHPSKDVRSRRRSVQQLRSDSYILDADLVKETVQRLIIVAVVVLIAIFGDPIPGFMGHRCDAGSIHCTFSFSAHA